MRGTPSPQQQHHVSGRLGGQGHTPRHCSSVIRSQVLAQDHSPGGRRNSLSLPGSWRQPLFAAAAAPDLCCRLRKGRPRGRLCRSMPHTSSSAHRRAARPHTDETVMHTLSCARAQPWHAHTPLATTPAATVAAIRSSHWSAPKSMHVQAICAQQHHHTSSPPGLYLHNTTPQHSTERPPVHSDTRAGHTPGRLWEHIPRRATATPRRLAPAPPAHLPPLSHRTQGTAHRFVPPRTCPAREHRRRIPLRPQRRSPHRHGSPHGLPAAAPHASGALPEPRLNSSRTGSFRNCAGCGCVGCVLHRGGPRGGTQAAIYCGRAEPCCGVLWQRGGCIP